MVVTWEVARQAVHAILRMPLDTLKAVTWDMVCFAVPSSQIELVSRVLARRGTGSFSPASRSVRPTGTRCGSRRWLDSRSAVGFEAADPEGHGALAAYMAVHGAGGAPGAPLTSVATLACMRVNEVARLQVW